MACTVFYELGTSNHVISVFVYRGQVKKRALSAGSRIVPLIRAGLIAGVVVAAASYPLAAVGGLGVEGRRRRDRRAAQPT